MRDSTKAYRPIYECSYYVYICELIYLCVFVMKNMIVCNWMVWMYLHDVYVCTLRSPLYDIPLYARSLIRSFAAPLYDGKVVPLHSHSFALQIHQIKFSKELIWKIICISRNKTQWIQWVWMQPSPRSGS